MVGADLLEAIARDEVGDEPGAGRALEHALDVAEPDRVLMPFLIHPAPRLLERQQRRATAHAALISHILGLLGATNSPGANSPGANVPIAGDWAAPGREPRGLPEPLSQAEVRVLRYLPTNLTVPEIADQLYLSVNTVRTHTRHIYDKLGAHRRHEAVELARGCGLLAPSTRRQGPRSTALVPTRRARSDEPASRQLVSGHGPGRPVNHANG
jgi:LuxR family maltose regulon positive regulatory protein